MKSKLSWLIFASSIAFSACSRDPGIVGSYIGGDQTGRMMIQITSAKDHDIRGKFIAVATTGTGNITAFDRPFEGTIDNGAVNLNMENGTAISLLTGKLNDQGLELTAFSGGSSQKLTFARRDPAEFTSMVDGVRHHAAELKQATAQEALQEGARADQARRDTASRDRLFAFTNAISGKAERLSESTIKIDGLIATYKSTSSQAARLRSLHAKIMAQSGNGDLRVDEISNARERNSDAAAAQHDMVQDALKNLNEASAENETEAQAISAQCAASVELNCRDVVSAMVLYRSRVAAFREAVARENSAYATERAKF